MINVLATRKSVCCINTKLSIWIILRLENEKNWLYYIATKKKPNEQVLQMQDRKAAGLTLLSPNEKQSHDILLLEYPSIAGSRKKKESKRPQIQA